MRVENIILTLVQQKIKDVEYKYEALAEGIEQYAADNNMQSLIEGQALDKAEFLVGMFMEPVLAMPQRVISCYFTNYAVIKEFKTASNNIFDMAETKYRAPDKAFDISDIESRIIGCISDIYKDIGLKATLETEISDVLVDIDYIKGLTDKMSFRLARKVNVK